MDFTVVCDCGATIPVSAVDAGAMKRCHCGNINVVPSLSELRRQAGQPSFEIGIADRIRHMVASGTLPEQPNCLRCGVETSNALQCLVLCEWPYKKDDKVVRTVLSTVLSGVSSIMLGRFVWFRVDDGCKPVKPETYGREVTVRVPLTLCYDCSDAVRKRPGRHLRCLLRSVSLYSQLLDQYPNAKLGVQ